MKKAIILLFLAICAYPETRVINYGVPGNNTNDLLARVKPCLSDSLDLVVMMIGTNDWINDKKFVPEEKYIKNLDSLCRTIPHLVIMTIPPARDDRGFWGRHKKSNYKASLDSLIARCNALIRQAGLNNGIDVIDIHGSVSPENLYDGVHIDHDGQVAIAAKIFIYMKHRGLTPKTIMCFGDSITAGNEKYPGYPHFLQIILRGL